MHISGAIKQDIEGTKQDIEGEKQDIDRKTTLKEHMRKAILHLLNFQKVMMRSTSQNFPGVYMNTFIRGKKRRRDIIHNKLEFENNTQKLRVDGVKQRVGFYNFDEQSKMVN